MNPIEIIANLIIKKLEEYRAGLAHRGMILNHDMEGSFISGFICGATASGMMTNQVAGRVADFLKTKK